MILSINTQHSPVCSCEQRLVWRRSPLSLCNLQSILLCGNQRRSLDSLRSRRVSQWPPL